MHLDKQNAQLGTKHGVHCRLTMGLIIGTTCLYSNLAVDLRTDSVYWTT